MCVNMHYSEARQMGKKTTNFRFDQQTSEVLEHLKKQSGASSKAEVVRKALQLLNVAQAAHQRGEKLILRPSDPNSPDREILLW